MDACIVQAVNPGSDRIACCSRAVWPDLALLGLAQIMSVSDRNNRRDGLTGALAVSRGRFFQVLEGEAPAVDQVMQRIRADPRHFDLEDVLRCEIQVRLFGAWSLVAAVVAPSLEPELDRAIGLCESQPEAAVQSLLALVERQRRG